MDTPLEVCEERDVKGLYKKARAGIIKGESYASRDVAIMTLYRDRNAMTDLDQAASTVNHFESNFKQSNMF